MARIHAYNSSIDYQTKTKQMIDSLSEWMIDEFNNNNTKPVYKSIYMILNALKVKNDDFPKVYMK